MKLQLFTVTYSLILCSFVWSRFSFFESSTQTSSKVSMLYDSVVVVFIFLSFRGLYLKSDLPTLNATMALMAIFSSSALFTWSLKSAKGAKIVFNNTVDQLYTEGAFGFVRHPFYTSYSLTWIGATYAVDYKYLYFPLAYLLVFYLITAISEERCILRGKYSEEYLIYRKNVGMFFPRINTWISLVLK